MQLHVVFAVVGHAVADAVADAVVGWRRRFFVAGAVVVLVDFLAISIEEAGREPKDVNSSELEGFVCRSPASNATLVERQRLLRFRGFRRALLLVSRSSKKKT